MSLRAPNRQAVSIHPAPPQSQTAQLPNPSNNQLVKTKLASIGWGRAKPDDKDSDGDEDSSSQGGSGMLVLFMMEANAKEPKASQQDMKELFAYLDSVEVSSNLNPLLLTLVRHQMAPASNNELMGVIMALKRERVRSGIPSVQRGIDATVYTLLQRLKLSGALAA